MAGDITQRIVLEGVPRISPAIETLKRQIASLSGRTIDLNLSTNATAQVEQMNAQFQNFGRGGVASMALVRREAQNFSQEVQRIGHHSSRVLDIFKGLALYRGFGVLTRAAGDFVKTLIELESQVLHIRTVMEDLEGFDFSEMRDAIIDISGMTAQSFEGVADAIYFVESAFESEIDTTKIVTEASKMATLQHASLDSVIQSLVTTLHLFGGSADDVHSILEKQFKLVQRGVFTYDQMISAFPKIATTAAMAGQSLESVAGAMAATSKAMPGEAFDRGATQLMRFYETLSTTRFAEKYRQLAMDVDGVSESIYDQNGNMRDAIDIMQDIVTIIDDAGGSAQDTAEVLDTLFSAERAKRGAKVLLQTFGAWKQFAGEQKEVTNLIEDNWAEMIKSVTFRLNQLKVTAMEAFVGIGDIFGPLIGGLTELLELFTQNQVVAYALAAVMITLGAAYLGAGSAMKALETETVAFNAALDLLNTTAQITAVQQELNAIGLQKEGVYAEMTAAEISNLAAVRARERESLVNTAISQQYVLNARMQAIQLSKQHRLSLIANVGLMASMVGSLAAVGAGYQKWGKILMSITMGMMTFKMVMTIVNEMMLATHAIEETRGIAVIKNLAIEEARSVGVVQAETAMKIAKAATNAEEERRIALGAAAAATQTGSKFGPWGAAIGAAAGIGVALAVLASDFGKVEEAAEDTSMALTTFKGAGGDLIDRLVEGVERNEILVTELFERIGQSASEALQRGFETPELEKLVVEELIGVAAEYREQFEEITKGYDVWIRSVEYKGHKFEGMFPTKEDARKAYGEYLDELMKIRPEMESLYALPGYETGTVKVGFDEQLIRVIEAGIPIFWPEGTEDAGKEFGANARDEIITALREGEGELEEQWGVNSEAILDSTIAILEATMEASKQARLASEDKIVESILSKWADVDVGSVQNVIDEIVENEETFRDLTSATDEVIEAFRNLSSGMEAIKFLETLKELPLIPIDNTAAVKEAQDQFLDNIATQVKPSHPLIGSLLEKGFGRVFGAMTESVEEVSLFDTKVVNEAIRMFAADVTKTMFPLKEFGETITAEELYEVIKKMYGFAEAGEEAALTLKDKIDELDFTDFDSVVDKMVDAGAHLDYAGYYFGNVADQWSYLGERWAEIQAMWEVIEMVQTTRDFLENMKGWGLDENTLNEMIGELGTIGFDLILGILPGFDYIVKSLKDTIGDKGFWEEFAKAITINQEQNISQGVTLAPYIQINTKEEIEDIDQIIHDALISECKRLGLDWCK